MTGGASLLALAVAGAAFAAPAEPPPPPTATVSEITQTGNNNEATVDQDGINASDVLQVGNGNIVDVEQDGEGNRSIIRQGDPDVDPEITTEIALGVVIQDGDDNFSQIVQVDRNDQPGTNGSTSGPAQAFLGVAGDPEAFVSQIGNENISYVDQNNANASRNLIASVEQTGDLNRSDISQDALGNSANGGLTGFTGTFSAIVTQRGDATSLVTQLGQDGGRGISAKVEQTDSTSTVIQRAFDRTEGATPYIQAEVLQESGSNSEINQTVQAGVDDSGELNAEVIQANGAMSEINQTAIGADVLLQVAVVDQDGESTSTINQTFSLANQFDLRAEVTQEGDSNESTVWQDGTELIAYVEQIGAGNISVVDQNNDATSSGNTADVDQLGDTGNSTIIQTGTGNSASLLQALGTDGNLSEITQSNSGNNAAVFQYSSDNASFITQSGTGGTITVTQGPTP